MNVNWLKRLFARQEKADEETPATREETSTFLGFDVKVIDHRTEEQKQVAEEGSKGIGVDPETEALIPLLTSAYEWGKRNGFPVFEEYPHYEQIRLIGKGINRKGGFEAMQRSYYYIHAQSSTLGGLLESFWHLIGDWRR